jgi:NAD-dependent DNA ligase
MSITILPTFGGENIDKLKGKLIFIPASSQGGKFIHYTRAELKKLITYFKGSITSKISKKTSFILAGVKKKPKGASEYYIPLTYEIEDNLKSLADKLNVNIISEREFITTYVHSTWFDIR